MVLERPLRDTILSALKTCTVFHFAGHAESHPSDPLKSSLLTTDWEKNPLTIEDFVQLNLGRTSPRLAYLSACTTSESHQGEFYDDAVHMMTACQMAGFQHVIGALWRVSDQCYANVAGLVYKMITDSGFIDRDKIAWSVHKAVRLLRDIADEGGDKREKDVDKRSDPLVWAAFIHVGS